MGNSWSKKSLLALGLLAASRSASALPWTKGFGGCIFSGDYDGAPLVRSGSCPTQGGELDLQNRGITSVPPQAFAGMAQMQTLYLYGNQLVSLPDSVFGGLSALQTLHLDNLVQCAPLSAQLLEGIKLYEGPLTCMSIPWTLAFGNCTFSGDYAGAPLVRSGSCPTQGGYLGFWGKGITSVPADAFAGMAKMEYLGLGRNKLVSLPASVFAGLSALTYLELLNNKLASLPASVFAGLSLLTQLWLSGNELVSLPDAVFDGLTALTTLELGGNDQLVCVPLTVKQRAYIKCCGTSTPLCEERASITSYGGNSTQREPLVDIVDTKAAAGSSILGAAVGGATLFLCILSAACCFFRRRYFISTSDHANRTMTIDGLPPPLEVESAERDEEAAARQRREEEERAAAEWRRPEAEIAARAEEAAVDIEEDIVKDIEDKQKYVVKEDRGVPEVSMKDLDVDHNPIGAGSFKVVFRARLRRDIAGVGDQGYKVAVMQIRQGISTLTAELNVFMILGKHPNLTRLVAVVRSDTGDVVNLLTEFAEMGSFDNVLTDVTDRGQKATADVLLTAAMQILDAMLQLQEHKMLHRDVALRNLLVFLFDPSDCDQVHVKLTDYGLAVTGSYIRMSTSNVGNGVPIRWMSPEAITHRRWSEKSDLWAFAVTLWEMFTHGGVPYMFIPSDEDVGQRVVQGHRLERPLSPAECPEGIFAVMLKCWQEKPEARPTFVEVKRMIQAEFRKGAWKKGECCICLESISLCHLLALVPCGHRCVCANHANVVVGRACPLCRTMATQTIRVFD